MSSMLDLLYSQLDQGGGLDELGAAVGADRRTTQAAVAAALPMLLGGLAHNASQPQGASALLGALDRNHDGSVLDDVVGFLGQGDSSPGEAILGHVFGGQRSQASAQLSQVSGLSRQGAAQLLALLAPLVLGLLGRQRRNEGLDAGGLAGLLRRERDTQAERAPDLFGMLGGLLDTNHDGSVVDDVARLGSGLLGNLLKGRSGS